jgi:hypothetical protein
MYGIPAEQIQHPCRTYTVYEYPCGTDTVQKPCLGMYSIPAEQM